MTQDDTSNARIGDDASDDRRTADYTRQASNHAQETAGEASNTDHDGTTADSTIGTGIDRRAFLTTAAATGSALGIGAAPVSADGKTDLLDGRCGTPQFDCGAVATAADGMVSTVEPTASSIGAGVLQAGGNAVDAAVAIHFALNVTAPHTSGIGGGGFMIIYDADSAGFTIVNSRERAPAGATPDMFLDADGEPIPFDRRVQLGEAVGVPGTLKGLETALELHGSRPLHRLIRPAIRLARKGFAVDEYFAETLEDEWEKLDEEAKSAYSNDAGEPLAIGDRLVQPDLAKTLRLIARKGSRPFYEGPIAQDLAAVVQERGGSMTVEDLAAYDVTLDEPIRKGYRDLEIVSQPPPSSGGITVAYILNVLEALDVERFGLRSAQKYHLLAEAMGLAYADRNAYIGDPEFVDVPVAGLLSDDYLASRASLVEMEDTLADYEAEACVEPGDPPRVTGSKGVAVETGSGGQTTHFSVVDGDGNVVSYTSTIEQLFGSGIMVPGRGFMLNNELTDFNAVPEGPNAVEPGKRPMSSMSPTIVMERGEPRLALGSPGGPTIITTVAQAILHHVDYDLELFDAIVEPSLYTGDCPPILWEPGVPSSARTETAALGHVWDDEATVLGNVNSVRIEDDRLIGAADPARDSLAVGYTRSKRARPTRERN